MTPVMNHEKVSSTRMSVSYKKGSIHVTSSFKCMGLLDYIMFRILSECIIAASGCIGSWPSFQVTFVTFHDRAARHKIGEGAQAHVLDVPA